MVHAHFGRFESVQRLLQEPRVFATIDAQVVENIHVRQGGEEREVPWKGMTALHFACLSDTEHLTGRVAELLKQAGASPLLVNMFGKTPLDMLPKFHPTHHTAISLLEAAVAEPQRTFLLAKARHRANTSHVLGRVRVATQGRTRGETMRAVLTRIPGDLNERVKKHQALAQVELQSAAEQQRAVLEYVLRTNESGEEVGAMEREGLPAELFVELLDMMMPRWDPLRSGAR